MLKYVDTAVTFAEIPDEITLCINISRCPCHCVGCHSSYLAEDIGKKFTPFALYKLIESNLGISCIAFMGGDAEPEQVDMFASFVKRICPLKTAWYSGRDILSDKIQLKNFDYIKIGHYDSKMGPLNSPTTNQIFYRIIEKSDGKYQLEDETYRFWHNVK